MRKAKLTQTCLAYPSQWEGHTNENEPIYIRFRWGYLSVSIGKVGQDIKEIYENKSFGWQVSNGFDGVLSFQELKEQLREKLDIEETI